MPEETNTFEWACVAGKKCRGDGRADEAQQSSGPQPSSPVESCGSPADRKHCFSLAKSPGRKNSAKTLTLAMRNGQHQGK